MKQGFGRISRSFTQPGATPISDDVHPTEDIFRQNSLLGSLSTGEISSLLPRFRTFRVEPASVLAEIGSIATRVYFPISGLLNVFVPTLDEQAVRIGTIGRDGCLGVDHRIRSSVRVVAQLPSVLLGILAPKFREIAETSPALRRIAAVSQETQLEQARSAAVCNLFHSAEQRFCRILLETSDRTSNYEVALTHEVLGELVGVQRSFVTAIASSLRRQGAIEYERGMIRLSGRETLMRLTCECYDRSKRASQELT